MNRLNEIIARAQLYGGDVQDIFNQKNQIDSAIDQVNAELQDPRFDNIRQLEKEISSLENEVRTLEDQKQKANSPEQIEVREKLAQKQAELEEQKALLTAERIKYAAEISSIPADALKEYFDGALAKVVPLYIQEAKKAAAEAKTEEEKKKKQQEEAAIEKLIRKSGRKEKKTRDGQTFNVPDKGRCEEILNELTKPGGATAFLKNVLSARNAETALKRNYGMSKEEAKAIIDKKDDSEFLKTVGQNLAKKVLADYILAGGKLSKERVLSLADTDWGKSIIEDGLKLADEQKKFLEDLAGKEVLSGGTINMEWLKQNWSSLGLSILLTLILLGITGSTSILPKLR
jgi:hypothetical protein